jgi:gliding motility-associated lipoprotein GldD
MQRSFLKTIPAVIIILLITVFIISCSNNSTYTPKPKGYFKIDFPEHTYRVFDTSGFPYSFEYPSYANVVRDSTLFEEQPENQYWVNIDFPRFQGRIYVSYIEIGGKSRYKRLNAKGQYVDSIAINTFDRLISTSYKLTFKHTLKASSIDDSVFTTPNGIEGVYFKIGGNAATANQFLVTDSVKHFLRGALYFDAAPNEDSLRVVNEFLRQDMNHLINTLKWKNQQ